MVVVGSPRSSAWCLGCCCLQPCPYAAMGQGCMGLPSASSPNHVGTPRPGMLVIELFIAI